MQQLVTNYLSQQTGTAALWIGVISVAVYVVVKIKKAVSFLWPFVRKLVTVVEDLFGAEARPGVEARPGLMERMKTSEENQVLITSTQNEINATLNKHSEALKELEPNHGGSMKDVLNAALRATNAQGERMDRLEEALLTHINDQRTAVSNAESAATNAREAVIGAQEAAVGAREAVVGARAAVVSAEAAVVAAVADRTAVSVHVTAGS